MGESSDLGSVFDRGAKNQDGAEAPSTAGKIHRSTSYKPPNIVSFLRKTMPRFGHSRSFADAISSDAAARRDYAFGVAAYASCLLALLLASSALLSVCRRRARRAARAVYGRRAAPRRKGSRAGSTVATVCLGGRSASDEALHSVRSGCGGGEGCDPEAARGGDAGGDGDGEEDPPADGPDVAPALTASSVAATLGAHGTTPRRYSPGSDAFTEDCESRLPPPTSPTSRSSRRSVVTSLSRFERRAERRRRRALRRRRQNARLATLCCGGVLIFAGLILLLFGVSSLKRATRALEESIVEAQDVIFEVSDVTSSVFLAASNVDSVRVSFGWDVNMSLCPTANVIGNLDMAMISSFMTDQLRSFDALISENATAIDGSVIKAQELLDEVENAAMRAKGLTWIIPFFLLTLCGAGVALFVGSIWEGKRGSPKRARRCMSRLIIPTFTFLVHICWMALIAAAIGSMLNNDACTGGEAPGSPDGTVIDILHGRNVDPESLFFSFVRSYTGGCKLGDPTESIVKLERELKSSLNFMQNILFQINSVGELGKECGNNSMEKAVQAAGVLATSLETVFNGTQDANVIMRCERINPIYVKAVRNSFCTDMAYGVSFSFIILSVISTCGLIIIGLRYYAINPRRKQSEHSIRNVGSLEYEEYVRYMSKYKHEWDNPYTPPDASSIMSSSIMSSDFESNYSDFFPDGTQDFDPPEYLYAIEEYGGSYDGSIKGNENGDSVTDHGGCQENNEQSVGEGRSDNTCEEKDQSNRIFLGSHVNVTCVQEKGQSEEKSAAQVPRTLPEGASHRSGTPVFSLFREALPFFRTCSNSVEHDESDSGSPGENGAIGVDRTDDILPRSSQQSPPSVSDFSDDSFACEPLCTESLEVHPIVSPVGDEMSYAWRRNDDSEKDAEDSWPGVDEGMANAIKGQFEPEEVTLSANRIVQWEELSFDRTEDVLPGSRHQSSPSLSDCSGNWVAHEPFRKESLGIHQIVSSLNDEMADELMMNDDSEDDVVEDTWPKVEEDMENAVQGQFEPEEMTPNKNQIVPLEEPLLCNAVEAAKANTEISLEYADAEPHRIAYTPYSTNQNIPSNKGLYDTEQCRQLSCTDRGGRVATGKISKENFQAVHVLNDMAEHFNRGRTHWAEKPTSAKRASIETHTQLPEKCEPREGKGAATRVKDHTKISEANKSVHFLQNSCPSILNRQSLSTDVVHDQRNYEKSGKDDEGHDDSACCNDNGGFRQDEADMGKSGKSEKEDTRPEFLITEERNAFAGLNDVGSGTWRKENIMEVVCRVAAESDSRLYETKHPKERCDYTPRVNFSTKSLEGSDIAESQHKPFPPDLQNETLADVIEYQGPLEDFIECRDKAACYDEVKDGYQDIEIGWSDSTALRNRFGSENGEVKSKSAVLRAAAVFDTQAQETKIKEGEQLTPGAPVAAETKHRRSPSGKLRRLIMMFENQS